MNMNRTQADIQEIAANEELFRPLKDSTILITGATGLIGSMLVKSVHAANKKYGLNIRVIGQIRNYEKARAVFGSLFESIEFVTDYKAGCDYLIHTVSPTASKYFIEHPVETIRTSVESTIDALEAAKENDAVMVYLSSMEQYGVPYEPGQKMDENSIGVIDHLNIRSSYSESKRLCECLCASYASEYKTDVRIARLAQTFGAGAPLSDNRMPMQFARSAAEGKDIILHTEGRSLSNFVYLTDAVKGILVILNKGTAGEAYNICNDTETKSVKEIAELVAGEVAGGTIKVKIENRMNMGYAPDTVMYLESRKLKNLGWYAEVGIKNAYERLVEYLRDNGVHHD